MLSAWRANNTKATKTIRPNDSLMNKMQPEINNLIAANRHYLAQAGSLLVRLNDKLFVRPSASCYQSTIGGHLRHCFDHYDSFLNGLSDAKVDYDARLRLPALEIEIACASAKAVDISARLKELEASAPAIELLVKMDYGMETIDWQPSTFGRELQFLISHTVHHFAMIGGICNEFDIGLDADFGVSPSTVRHRALTSA